MDLIQRPLQLVLIRHAESLRNEAKKGAVYFADEAARSTVKGIPDYKIPLTETGKTQALITGRYLRRVYGVPDYFYHSGYKRTEETLNEILKGFSFKEQEQIRVRQNQFVRERDPGYAYDMMKEEAEAAFPWLYDHWQTFGGFFARPPGGESLSDVSDRVYNFLNTLFRDRAGKKVWVVLHGGTLRAVRFLLERWTFEQALTWPEGESPQNCGITVYNFDPDQGRLVLDSYNYVAYTHLK